MKRLRVPMKGPIAGAVLVAALSLAGPPPVSAEEAATTSTTSTTASTTTRKPRATATPEMIAEAIDRSQARTRRFLSEGVPEQFGSEGSSYTFDASRLTAE